VPTTTTMRMTVPGLVTTTVKAKLTTTTTTTTVAPSDCPFSDTEHDSPCRHTMCAINTTSLECVDAIAKYCARMYGACTAVNIHTDPGCVAIVKQEIKPMTTTPTPKTTTVGIVSLRPTTTTKGTSECPFDHEAISST
jgi:hypothetical protein